MPFDVPSVVPARVPALRVCGIVLIVLAVCVSPVAAQSSDSTAQNPICADESGTLAAMIEGFLRITTGLGLMGLLMVWQAEALLEVFMFDQERKVAIKRHKRQALKSALLLTVIGPLFAVAGSAMGLPIADCVDLVPF